MFKCMFGCLDGKVSLAVSVEEKQRWASFHFQVDWVIIFFLIIVPDVVREVVRQDRLIVDFYAAT